MSIIFSSRQVKFEDDYPAGPVKDEPAGPVKESKRKEKDTFDTVDAPRNDRYHQKLNIYRFNCLSIVFLLLLTLGNWNVK